MSLANKLSSRVAHLRQLATAGQEPQRGGVADHARDHACLQRGTVPAARTGSPEPSSSNSGADTWHRLSPRHDQIITGGRQSRGQQAAQFAARLASAQVPEQQHVAPPAAGKPKPRRAQKPPGLKRSKGGQERSKARPAAGRPGWDTSFASAAEAAYVANVRNCKQVTRLLAPNAAVSGVPRSADAPIGRAPPQPHCAQGRRAVPAHRLPPGGLRAPAASAKQRFAKCMARHGAADTRQWLDVKSQPPVGVQLHDAADSGAPGSLFAKYALGAEGARAEESAAAQDSASGTPRAELFASQQTIHLASRSSTPVQRGPPDVLAVATPPPFGSACGAERSRSLSLCGFDAAMCGSTDLVRLEASAQLAPGSSDREPSPQRSATPDAELPLAVAQHDCTQPLPSSSSGRLASAERAQRAISPARWLESSHMRSGSLLHGREDAAAGTRGSAPWSDASQSTSAGAEAARSCPQKATVACSPLGQPALSSRAAADVAQCTHFEPHSPISRHTTTAHADAQHSGADATVQPRTARDSVLEDTAALESSVESAAHADVSVKPRPASATTSVAASVLAYDASAASQCGSEKDAELLDSIDLAKLRFSEDEHGWVPPVQPDSSATFQAYMAGAHAWTLDGMQSEELPSDLPQLHAVEDAPDSEGPACVGAKPHTVAEGVGLPREGGTAGSFSEEYSASDYDD